MGYTLESHNGYFIYHYNPSIVAAVIFAVLFAIITAAHIWRMIRNHLWFCIPFVIGGIFETVGYGGRAASHNNTGSLIPYVIQSVLLLVAPALFAASIYMTLGRTIRDVKAEKHSIIRVHWLTKIFVIGDVLSFFIQSGGAGLQVKASSADDAKTGQNIIIAGLFAQIIMFGLFAFVAMVFQKRLNTYPTREAFDGSVPWRSNLFMLYGASAFIMVRSIFRVVEYLTGNDGYPLQHEWTLYVFDGVLMFATMVVFFVWYPSRAVSRDSDVELVGGNGRRIGKV